MAEINDESAANILNEFYGAAATLFTRREAFHDLANLQKKKIGVRRAYKKSLREIVKMVADRNPASAIAVLARSPDYLSCSRILDNHGRFVRTTEKDILKQLKATEKSLRRKIKRKTGKGLKAASAEEDFIVRIASLPTNAESVSLIKWMSGQYRNALTIISEKFEETVISFSQCSENLPISYKEYQEKMLGFYAAASGLSESKKSILAMATFDRLHKVTGLRGLPKPKS